MISKQEIENHVRSFMLVCRQNDLPLTVFVLFHAIEAKFAVDFAPTSAKGKSLRKLYQSVYSSLMNEKYIEIVEVSDHIGRHYETSYAHHIIQWHFK